MKLELHNLRKSYDQVRVVKGMDLQLHDIHSLGIIGPSGGGKSTLLRLLAGIERPDSGTITINNTTLKNDENFLNDYRKTIGVVFQSYNLFPHLTAGKNVTLPLEKIHHYTPENSREISAELFARFMLKDHMHKKPSQLSGGQQQRVAIIRALSSGPQILLFDEPTSALDPELAEEVLNTIYEIRNDHKDLILVTHQLSFARMACDYLLFIEDGKIIEHNQTQEFFENPQTERLWKFLNPLYHETAPPGRGEADNTK
ncbi:MAG: amino acid ABC transporter ATP-binding protein [Peptococcaceae bacterium]